MKIVYLMASTGAWGGLEKHVFELAGAMAERGHEVNVLADAGYAAHCPPGVQLQAFDWAGSRWNPLRWLKLRSALHRLAPDIVHAHAAKAVALLTHAGWPRGAQAVGTVHNLKSGYSAYRRLDAVIAVSKIMVPHIPHANITVVHNGIREQTPRPEALARLQAWKHEQPAPLALAIGRLVPAKGFDLLLQAWPRNTQATLLILGGGDERTMLEKIIAERSLANVHLMGESTEVREWLACADLLVISSRHEGGPYVLAEALLAHVPVISTEVGMVADFLPPECLLPNQDQTIAALAQHLAQALADITPITQACLPAMQKAREQLTLAAMAGHTEQVYLHSRQNANLR